MTAQVAPVPEAHGPIRMSLRGAASEVLAAVVRDRLAAAVTAMGEASRALEALARAVPTIEERRDAEWRQAIASSVLLGGIVSRDAFADALLGELSSKRLLPGDRHVQLFREAAVRAAAAPGLADETLARLVELLETQGPGLTDRAPEPSLRVVP